jgi:hypothetical protein
MAGFFALALVAVASGEALAHEQKTALTDLWFNERTGNLEIAHRIRIHDAEHALRKTTGSTVDLVGSSEARAAFADYVVQRFYLSTSDKKRLPLKLLGEELERGFLWVYQEIPMTKLSDDGFFIANTILQDAIEGQVNTVNVRRGSNVTTLVFRAGSGRLRYPGAEG